MAREGGWRLEVPAKTKGPAAQALDFVLDEVREAHLVPVVDFKGKARVKPAETAPTQAVAANDGE